MALKAALPLLKKPEKMSKCVNYTANSTVQVGYVAYPSVPVPSNSYTAVWTYLSGRVIPAVLRGQVMSQQQGPLVIPAAFH